MRAGRWFLVASLVIAFGSLTLQAAPAGDAGPDLRTENRLRELGHVMHPGVVSGQLQELLGPMGILGQSLGAAVIIGGFVHRLRRDQIQLEGIASMMLKVAIIAMLPVWKGWVLESAAACSEMLGGNFVPETTLELTEVKDRGAASPLMTRLWALGEQWALESSPVADSVAGAWKAGSGKDEERIAEGWNWAKPAVMGEHVPAELAWAAETNARRAELVQGLVMGGAGSVHLTTMAHFCAESARLVLFHAGCALAPMFIAGLGIVAFQTQSLRALLGILGTAFWPLSWALGNVVSLSMLNGTLELCRWTNSSAMFPKLADDTQRTLAMSAPYLSWWLLGMMVALTLCLCLWMCTCLLLGPWLLHKALASGARWTTAEGEVRDG